jgi:hypothetical protein
LSANTANSTLMTPIETAPAQNTSRGCHTRREPHIARERRSMGCFRDVPAMSVLAVNAQP